MYLYLILIFIELACPCKFSYSAKFITEEPSLSIPDLDILIIDCLFKKSYADNPDENLAVPEVGNT